MIESPSAFFIVGPTAVGKTAVAHLIAREDNAQILSADSMLVYRGMDTGTAKPTRAMRDEVVYRGIDLVAPDASFSTGAYMAYARTVCAAAAQQGCPTVVVGGTGLYIQCLTAGLADLPPADAAIRTMAQALLDEQGVRALQAHVQVRAPEQYAALADPENPRRLIRALEIGAHQTTPPSRVTATESSAPLIGLKMALPVLYERIEERVGAFYEAGLINEVRALRETYPALSRTAQQAIGYREAGSVIDGQLDLDEAIRITTRRTRRYAKRQMTWFRHQAHVEWVDVEPGMDRVEIAQAVRSLWRKHGRTSLRFE